jgi:hypothetical protein
VPSDPTSFLHYPDTTLDLGQVPVGTGQVDYRYTWNRLNQTLQGREYAIGMHHCDVKTVLETILINLLESLEYLRYHAVYEVIDGCECYLAVKCQEERILVHKEYTSIQKCLCMELH